MTSGAILGLACLGGSQLHTPSLWHNWASVPQWYGTVSVAMENRQEHEKQLLPPTWKQPKPPTMDG